MKTTTILLTILTFWTHSYSIGHLIDRVTDTVKNERTQLLKSIDFEFVTLAFLSFLTYLVIFTTLIYLFFKRISLELLFEILVNQCSKQISKHVFIGLNVYGFVIFLFLVIQIMTNNIKVSILKTILETIYIF